MATGTALLTTGAVTEEPPVYGPFEGEPCRGRPFAVVQGVARCSACVTIKERSCERATIAVMGPFPWNNPLFQDGYHCGDALVSPNWTQPKTARIGYGGPTKMTAWLPGGSKYTGAMYEGDELATGPVRGAKRTSRIETASVVAVEEVEQASVPAIAEDPEPPEEQFKDGFEIKIAGWVASPELPTTSTKCPACKGEGTRKRKRWSGRWNGIGDPYRISKCRACRGTGSVDGISEQPGRKAPPATPGSSLRALSELMGDSTSGAGTPPAGPRAQRTGDVETWMRNYLGMQTAQPTAGDPIEHGALGIAQGAAKRLEMALDQERALTARQYVDIEQLKVNRDRWIDDYKAAQIELDGQEEIIRGLRADLENAKNDLGLMYKELVRVRQVADGNATVIEGECRELVRA